MPTMRRDLHIGLAIGGVLLAVLIVWGVVVSGSKKHKDVTLQTVGNPATDIPPASPADATPAPAATDSNPSSIAPPPIIIAAPAPAPAPTAVASDNNTPAPATTAKKGDEWVGLLAGTTPAPLLPASDTSKQIDAAAPIVTQTPDPIGPVTSAVQPGSQQIPAPAADATTPTPAPAATVDSHPAQDTSAAPAPGTRTHTVAKGETFSSIAKVVYGDARYYQKIAQANPKINPNRLRPGTVITLPDAANVKKSSSKQSEAKPEASANTDTASKPAAAPVDTQKEYRVVSGDSLYRISTRLYGSGEEADHLYDLNKEKIGPDKGKLKLGMILKIPSPPTVATASTSR
jgi:nucleoid-associated protein YgaU